MRRETLELKRRSEKVKAQVATPESEGELSLSGQQKWVGTDVCLEGSMIPSPGIHTFVQFTPFECGMEQVTCF